jgi:hypothetical protein
MGDESLDDEIDGATSRRHGERRGTGEANGQESLATRPVCRRSGLDPWASA